MVRAATEGWWERLSSRTPRFSEFQAAMAQSGKQTWRLEGGRGPQACSPCRLLAHLPSCRGSVALRAAHSKHPLGQKQQAGPAEVQQAAAERPQIGKQPAAPQV